jgi:hypothetical protein
LPNFHLDLRHVLGDLLVALLETVEGLARLVEALLDVGAGIVNVEAAVAKLKHLLIDGGVAADGAHVLGVLVLIVLVLVFVLVLILVLLLVLFFFF